MKGVDHYLLSWVHSHLFHSGFVHQHEIIQFCFALIYFLSVVFLFVWFFLLGGECNTCHAILQVWTMGHGLNIFSFLLLFSTKLISIYFNLSKPLLSFSCFSPKYFQTLYRPTSGFKRGSVSDIQ